MRDDVRFVLWLLGSLATAAAVVRWIVLPGWRDAFTWSFGANLGRLLAAMLRALKDDEEARVLLRKSVELVFPDRINRVDRLENDVGINKDRLEGLEASVRAQGEALTKDLSRAMEHIASSTDRQTRALERIETELRQHGEQIGRMDERIKAWDGIERRQIERRHGGE